jgi:AraC family transcriptional regulator, positive regulator of tynA and feaB
MQVSNTDRVDASIEAFEQSLRHFFGDFHVDRNARESNGGGFVSPGRYGPFDACQVTVEGVTGKRGAMSEKWRSAAFLLVAYSGTLVIEHESGTSLVSPGEMILLDSQTGCRPTPLGKSQSISYAFDRAALTLDKRNCNDLFGVTIPAAGPGKMLFHFLQSLRMETAWEETDRQLATELLGEFINRAVVAPASRSHARDMVLSNMRQWVESHIGQDSITPDSLASRFAMSRRTLFRLFAEEGTTPSRWILDLRLEAARRQLLRAPARANQISQIAYDAGFEDASQFSKSFRKKFGRSPRDYRRN